MTCMMLGFYQTICQENGFLQEVFKYVSRMGNTKATHIQQREFGTVFTINTNKRGEIWLQWHYKLSSSVIESVSESKSLNSSFSDNEADSPIKRKRKQRRIQLLCAEELSKEQPHESYERKLDIVENGKNNGADDTEKNLKK